MLYILNKPARESLRQLAMIGADDEDKAVLLVSDGVFLALDGAFERFEELGVDEVFAAEDALEARAIQAASDVEVLDYDDMAELLEEHDKIISL